MKLVVPFVGELDAKDARLIRLAKHLGISFETLALPKDGGQHGQYLERAVPDGHACLVVNPEVMRSWIGGDAFPDNLAACITSRFPHVIVYGLQPKTFHINMAIALSDGQVRSVEFIDAASQYEVDRSSEDICGPFAGLTLGPADPANDCVVSAPGHDSAVRELISIGGAPFMLGFRRNMSEILFIASGEVADLDAEVGDTPLSTYFSRLLPHAMALRHAFGAESWRPSGQYAAVIIDDPLLSDSYGFLNFEALRRLTNRHRFHTTIAFIPHNFRRNSARTIRMFRENPDHLGICFHGNDHTGAELASTDMARLNTMLHIAEGRMRLHGEMTGLACDKVMVFPQGKFSIEAMRVLKSRNFHAAVNTVPYPMGQPVRLTIGELAQPAILRYAGFPLFLRKPIQQTQKHDIAFDLFFGKPVLIVEHHDIFQRPDSLAQLADTVNSLAPEIRWSNLATAVNCSTLQRCSPDGVHHIRAYSGATTINNPSSFSQRFSVAWSHAAQYPQVDEVLRNKAAVPACDVEDKEIRVSVEIPPGESETFTVKYRNEQATQGSLGLRWSAKAFLRRRFSELRDNHLSKSPRALAVAKTLQRRLQPVR